MPIKKASGTYWVSRRRAGEKVVEQALGPDTPDLREKIEQAKEEQALAKAQAKLTSSSISMLKSAGALAPDVQSGKLFAALSKAGFFESGGVLGGTMAFRHYPLLLGMEAPETSFLMTADMDLLASSSLKLNFPEGSLSAQLLSLGIPLEPIFPMDPKDPMKWLYGEIELELLSPVARGGQASRLHEGVGERVQALPFLEFSVDDTENAISLYRSGSLIRVPKPERYALHKLLVAESRTGSFSAKSQKDLAQADWLIEALNEVRPYELYSAWENLQSRGKKWRSLASRALNKIPASRAILNELSETYGDEPEDFGIP